MKRGRKKKVSNYLAIPFFILFTKEHINKLFNSPLTISPFIWETRLGKVRFQIEAMTLIHNITENRLRHARGPVQNTESVTYITSYFTKFEIFSGGRSFVQHVRPWARNKPG